MQLQPSVNTAWVCKVELMTIFPIHAYMLVVVACMQLQPCINMQSVKVNVTGFPIPACMSATSLGAMFATPTSCGQLSNTNNNIAKRTHLQQVLGCMYATPTIFRSQVQVDSSFGG